MLLNNHCTRNEGIEFGLNAFEKALVKTRELRSDESTFVWTTLLFSLGKGVNYFLSFPF